MITCPKCGFKNDQPQATDCPKCGLIYAKFQRAQTHKSVEQALNDSFKDAMPSGHEEEPRFTDLEPQKDDDSYSGIVYLSWFFIGFSCVLGLIWVAEIKFFWSFIDSYQIFKGSDKLLVILLFAMFSSLPVAIYLSVGGALKLGKDIADNTRATRNYLAYLVKTKNR